METPDPNFSWVKTHKELVEYLATKQDDQKGLIALLKEVGITMFNDQDPKEETIELEEIDPFSFFCYIYKYGDEKRLAILQKIAKKLGLSIPDDGSGMPSSNAQKVWLFPYKYDRVNNEIGRLWAIFISALDESITDEQFADVLNINSTGQTKLTEGLFSISPEKYFPINGPIKPYLKEVFSINPKFKTFSDYSNILKQVREKTDQSFYQLSYEAWLWNDKRSKDPNFKLIESYKKRIKKNKLTDERYKWELVNKYQGLPDLNADDLHTEVKQIDFSNLVYALGGTIFKHLVRDDPSDMKILLGNLYEESQPLDDRITKYDEEVMKLYRAKGGEHSHHQDERTVSVLLTYKYPEKYTFYKSSYYKKYCELLKIEPSTKGEKYGHYMSLINSFIDDYIVNDNELTTLVDRLLPEYNQSNNLILAQDILYQILDQEQAANYWVFQGNPKVYDFETAIRNNLVESWTVTAHLDKIKVGDKVILWITGKDAGCYALAEITEEVHPRRPTADDHLWTAEEVSDKHVGLELTHNLINNPITKDQISEIKELSKLKVGFQGSNFSATEKEYKEILKLAENSSPISHDEDKRNDMELPLNLIMYGPPGTGKTYHTIDKAVEIIAPEEYDPNSHDANRIIYKKLLDQGNIVFTTFHQSYSYEDFIEGIKPQLNLDPDGISQELEYQIVDGLFKETTLAASEQISFVKTKDTGMALPPELFNENNVFKISLGDTLNSEDDSIYKYCLQNNCIAIGWGEDIDFTGVKNRKEIREKYNDNGVSITGQMDFNISAIERLVIWMEENNLILISNGNRKLRAIARVSGGYYCDPTAPIGYNQFRKVEWLKIDLNIPVKEFYPKFFSQQSIYLMFRDQIDKSFFTSPKSSESDKYTKYVIIIDEINRGNVSQIFGELITLIEDDKRSGENEALEITLPYSKKLFSVPPNLYIIGTMNTADRSVEALDTALRRRFSFEEMLPNPEILIDKTLTDSKISLVTLLSILNDRIEILVDRDHTIGHAFFMELSNIEELQNVFADKVIPLLQEYFYGDYGKMEMVIGKAFFNINDSKVQFATSSNDGDDYSDTKPFHLKTVSKMSSEDFESAVLELISPDTK